MTRFITAEDLKKKAIQRRIAQELKKPETEARNTRIQELEDGQFPMMKLKEGLELKHMFKPSKLVNGTATEFATTGDYASAWKTRQRYEFEVGRDSAPLLYPSIYNVTVDPSLDQLIDVYTINPNGFIFEPVAEGAEMKITQVGSGNYSIRLGRIAVGVEYTEELFMFNRLYRIANFERYAAIGHNAYANHVHFSPILDATYTGDYATDGTTLTTFNVDDPLPLKYQRTLEAAIQTARMPGANRRPGSYALLISSGDMFTMERALLPVAQEGFSVQSPTLNAAISDVIVYDGWSGTRGKKEVSYDGVEPGFAYLVDLSQRETDFQSYWKWMLRLRQGDGDLSRNIEAQAFWDSYMGVYANPTVAVAKITLPEADSGETP